MRIYDLGNNSNIYFLGIGGISMSGLALVLKKKGYSVSGSDSKHSDMTDKLEKNGIKVNIGQVRENIDDSIDAAVYTAAISPDNEEFLAVKEKGIKLIPRSTLLGIIMEQFENSVAIAGTHGKTTTTSMVSQILIDAGTDPTISIGGIIPSINSNTRIGSSDFFVAEACEYTNSFLELNPKVSIVLNIELDHIDYFKNMDEINTSFKGFIANVKSGGTLVINSEIEGYEALLGSTPAVTYGIGKPADWMAKNIVYGNDFSEFDLCFKGECIGRAQLALPGEHNISNTLAACAATHFLGVPKESIAGYIQNFSGTKRRFELKGQKNGYVVFDDYAHHPSEIKATLKAARSRCKDGKIWCVFQPHTYSRTKAFFNEFSMSFSDADTVILTDIYAAREKDTGDIHSTMLADKINVRRQNAVYFQDFKNAEKYLADNCKPGDMVLTMGAGDVYVIGEQLLTRED